MTLYSVTECIATAFSELFYQNFYNIFSHLRYMCSMVHSALINFHNNRIISDQSMSDMHISLFSTLWPTVYI
jgi:hypothetical protein